MPTQLTAILGSRVNIRCAFLLAAIALPALACRTIAIESSPTVPICIADLKSEIDRIVERPQWQRSLWGIKVQPLGKSQDLYDRNSERYFIPASNVKLLTTAAALLRFGQNYRIQTPVYFEENAGGRLTIVGQGDPSLTSAQLEALAQKLKQQGLKQIQTLVARDAVPSERWLNGSWEWSDLAFYFASPMSHLNLNQNQVILTLTPSKIGWPLQENWSDPIAARQWQIFNRTQTTPKDSANDLSILPIFGSKTLKVVGSLAQNAGGDRTRLAIPNPPQYFLDSLQFALRQRGIEVKQAQIQANADYNPQSLLANFESPPLSDLIAQTNQESINLYAEALLNLLGKDTAFRADSDRFAPLKSQLQSLGIEGDRYQLADGSGLSRQNLVSPSVFVQLLQAMAQTPYGRAFRASLAIAGERGTLNAYRDTPLAGKVRAKTGTLTGVYALSGYIDLENGATLAFSIILNNSTQSPSQSRQTIQDILFVLHRFRDCR